MGLCAYANRNSDFQNYLLENQADFSTRDLMDDLANYNNLKILNAKLNEELAVKPTTSNTPGGKSKI